MAVTLTTSGAVLVAAGKNVHTDLINGTTVDGRSANTVIEEWINNAESWLSVKTQFDWIENFDSLHNNVKKIISTAVANKAAIQAIKYSLENYGNRLVGETMANIAQSEVDASANLLFDKNPQDFMKRESGISTT